MTGLHNQYRYTTLGWIVIGASAAACMFLIVKHIIIPISTHDKQVGTLRDLIDTDRTVSLQDQSQSQAVPIVPGSEEYRDLLRIIDVPCREYVKGAQEFSEQDGLLVLMQGDRLAMRFYAENIVTVHRKDETPLVLLVSGPHAKGGNSKADLSPFQRELAFFLGKVARQ